MQRKELLEMFKNHAIFNLKFLKMNMKITWKENNDMNSNKIFGNKAIRERRFTKVIIYETMEIL